MQTNMAQLLHHMVQLGASDMHLKSNSSPGFRVNGKLRRADELGVLGADEVLGLAHELMTPEQVERFDEDRDLDLSHAVKGLARFRVNVLLQRSTPAIVVRQIPDRIPTIEELELPRVCAELATRPRGLVLVTGPTGSGKSTTLAAMIDHINTNQEGHILTMEDPLEFVHKDKKCFVTQRQIGQDCRSFDQALRRALRQDPDVILIGEMRDLETISLAVTAAETGHLVLGTLHTTGAISTEDRMIEVFPPDAQQQIRVALSSTLQGVISQTLVERKDGGRSAVHDILVATDGVRSLIREGKTAQILSLQQTGKGHGMQTLEASLTDMVRKGIIDLDVALAKANRPEEVQKQAGGRGMGRVMADPDMMRGHMSPPGGARRRRA